MKFEELLQEYDIEVAPEGHEHKRAGWIQFDCPFCSPGWSHYRMGYNVQYGYVNCWACGRHGLLETVAAVLNKAPAACRKLLEGLERDSLTRVIKRRGSLVLPRRIKPLQGCHKRYLRGRGFDIAELEKLWSLKGIGLSDNLAWRIFIPIYLAGELVSWTTRSISDTNRHRYISAKPSDEIWPHKDLLYGEDYARHSIIVCEGPTDVWRIGPGAVATLGTSYSRTQIERMGKYHVRAVCFDDEPTAQRRAKAICQLLGGVPRGHISSETQGERSGSAQQKEINKLRKEFLDA